ncbi:MAG: YicC family protein [Acidobacteria bacterium]|nr:YicC family protein [Acidobacteriota bacterium]
MLSMTGYGTARGECGGANVAVEVRTVNHRFLDPHVRLPREYLSLEPRIHQAIRGAVRRGRVDVTVSIETERPPAFTFNVPAARGYCEAAKVLCEELGLAERLDLKTLVALPGVVADDSGGMSLPDTVPEKLATAILGFVGDALSQAGKMRLQEGRALRDQMLRQLDILLTRVSELRVLAATAATEYQERLTEKLEKLLGRAQVDEERLEQEVAIMAEKSDFTEELARLESHAVQFRGLMDAEEVGKRMDFLLQEMQREANTILSKSGSLEVSRQGIAIKSVIEKLREQVQNIE